MSTSASQRRYARVVEQRHNEEVEFIDLDRHSRGFPKSSSFCDLILSVANTLDHEDTKANMKRKLTSFEDNDDDSEIKKKLLKIKKLFSVEGYPPGFDPFTLPPSHSSPRPAPKSLKGKIIDPDR